MDSNPKTATKLEEVDLLRYKNWELRRQILDGEHDALVKAMVDKYGVDGADMNVNLGTGEIARTNPSVSPPTGVAPASEPSGG